jgi:spore coat-associated protein N
MERISFLISNPRRALGALAAVVAATGVVIGSGANFTAASANPSNTLSTGSLSILNDKEGAAILTASNMRPGDPATVGTVDIKNTGTLSGTFSLSRGTPVDSDAGNPLSGKLNVVVTDCGVWTNDATPNVCGDGDDSAKYTGTLAAMSSPIALGSFAAGAKHTYRFAISLDGTAGDAYQGDNTQVAFNWNAVQ